MSTKKKALICSYCKQPCEWVENKEVYGKNYGDSYMIWLCRPCNAYVGCHNNSKKALGRVATKELRQLRMEAKNLFIAKYLRKWNCPSWVKESMYKRLAKEIDIPLSQCHFGMFNEERCRKIINLLIDKVSLTTSVPI